MGTIDPEFSNTVVFTGGGTGGHFFPAVALAEGVRARWPQVPVVFVGAKRGIEARLLPESPWPHLLLDVDSPDDYQRLMELPPPVLPAE